ncbi:hypothetical protein PROVRETT_10123 [Providencia rettgeri DSM 1131]|nr:hypothetical protein PROVRETT_10123 [Providencia rettgeri DSM 1131]
MITGQLSIKFYPSRKFPGAEPHLLHSGSYTGKGQITLYLP